MDCPHQYSGFFFHSETFKGRQDQIPISYFSQDRLISGFFPFRNLLKVVIYFSRLNPYFTFLIELSVLFSESNSRYVFSSHFYPLEDENSIKVSLISISFNNQLSRPVHTYESFFEW